MEAGVGQDGGIRRRRYALPIGYEVEIEHPRRILAPPCPAEGAFDRVKGLQKRIRFEIGTHLGDGIDEIRLIG